MKIHRMDWSEKAQENLQAAEQLLPGDNAGVDACLNASVSRSYYAAYLAVATRAAAQNRRFTGDDYYRHDSFPAEARTWGILDDDDTTKLELLLSRRIVADYHEESVDIEEADGSLNMAKELVLKLLDGGA